MQRCDLSHLAYNEQEDLWDLETSDDDVDVHADGFFNPAAHLLDVGDIIRIDGDNSNQLLVVSCQEGVVEVCDLFDEVEAEDESLIGEVEEF